MDVSKAKRFEYWNHFLARWVLEKVGGGYGITGPRLRKIFPKIMEDDDFWWDIVSRHGGCEKTPEQMELEDQNQYDHCWGNFWGMIMQDLVEARIIKV